MRRGSALLTSLALIVPLASCTTPDLTELTREYVDQVEGVNTRTCDCPELLGYSSILECQEALGTPGGEEEQCIANVLDGSEVEGEEWLQCASLAMADYSACLAANGSCDMSAYEACASANIADLAACASLPASTRQSVQLCASQ